MNRYTWRTGVLEAVMIVAALVFLFPIYILVNLALRGADDASLPQVPTASPTFDNFITVWTTSDLVPALLNSVFVTVVAVLLIVLIGSLASYGIVRSTSRWSIPAFYFFLLGLLLPFQLIMVPMYQNFAKLGWIGSPLVLIALYAGQRMPFTIFLYSAFLRQLSTEYEEAASIDGAGVLRRFFQIVFPLMRPVTGSVVILNGLFVWNDFLAPLLYVGNSQFRTAPIEIYSFVSENATEWPVVFAALIIATLPVLIVFFVLQKSLIQGFASGVKG
ncbi:MAG: carbohydrate ABC transporter permease [Protaetiibacter sp.]